MNDKYLTVSAITRYLKSIFDKNEHLQHVFLKGEISNFKSHSTGHLYFSIKDENSKINAIMFSSAASKLNFTPVEGSKVLVTGRISIYEVTGNYQIYVDEMQEDGIGNLYLAYEKLKKELEKEGLFKEEHKKPIPLYPKKVGIVTAPTGAAIRDIISTIKRRYPICETYLFPSLVQGDGAAPDIVKNILKAQEYDLDVLIVGRGGGSIEDLWAFNEEIVARAIYNSKIPIISAVGHEIDFTIADFVADKRAATPTGAAELAVPNIEDVLLNLEQNKIRLKEAMIKKVKYASLKLDAVKSSYVIKNPLIMYDNKKQKIDLLNKDLNNIMSKIIDNTRNNLNNIITKIELMNPLTILKRGYSITYLNDKVLKDDTKLVKDDLINIKTGKRSIKAQVIDVKENLNGKN